MRRLSMTCLLFIPFCVHAQSNLDRGEIALKWDASRIANPFNSTIQVGAEIGLSSSLTIHCDIGINSNLYKDTYYNRKIFISHNQLRKYKRDGNFYGIDIFYMHAKDYSDFRCLYDKNKKISSDYDSVMLIKNAPGISIIAGRQVMIGNFVIDLFCGAGLRLVSNKPDYVRQSAHAGDCPQTHFAWHNDRYSGTFAGGHISLGIKLGYVVIRKPLKGS